MQVVPLKCLTYRNYYLVKADLQADIKIEINVQ